MTTPSIPFLDLVTPHVELEKELTEVFQKALRSASFIGGPMVDDFERAFADFCSTRYCVGVNSGTDALRFALMAAGIGAGDAVVTVPHTFIATTEAISQCGAVPEFVDIDERTYNMDPARLREYLETGCEVDAAGELRDRKTKARVAGVVPVHLYGQPADMDAILELAAQYKLVVVEDACQAHGAEYFSKKENRWRKAGSMGVAGAFSFYPGKNLGACGEGGAVTTNDAGIAKTIRMLRDHGQAQKYYHSMEGYNGRLDAIQAGMLRVKLRHLAEWNARRRAAAARYGELFAAAEARMVLPYEPEWTKAIYHLYVVRVANRDELMKQLGALGIGTGIHYPVPLHIQDAYKGLGYQEGDLPVTERVAKEIVSLPMFPQLTAEQQERVVKETVGLMAAAVGR
jgi:dTDP-4-amino-4,6-dideoxygalactose transaminase